MKFQISFDSLFNKQINDDTLNLIKVLPSS